MQFTREDFQIESVSDLMLFLPIAPFIGLVAPFLLAAYTLGAVMDMIGWLETD